MAVSKALHHHPSHSTKTNPLLNFAKGKNISLSGDYLNKTIADINRIKKREQERQPFRRNPPRRVEPFPSETTVDNAAGGDTEEIKFESKPFYRLSSSVCVMKLNSGKEIGNKKDESDPDSSPTKTTAPKTGRRVHTSKPRKKDGKSSSKFIMVKLLEKIAKNDKPSASQTTDSKRIPRVRTVRTSKTTPVVPNILIKAAAVTKSGPTDGQKSGKTTVSPNDPFISSSLSAGKTTTRATQTDYVKIISPRKMIMTEVNNQVKKKSLPKDSIPRTIVNVIRERHSSPQDRIKVVAQTDGNKRSNTIRKPGKSTKANADHKSKNTTAKTSKLKKTEGTKTDPKGQP